MNTIEFLDNYGINIFDEDTMKTRIPKSIYRDYKESLNEDEPLSKETATAIANAMKIWAIEKGATHFTHWFTPMTGLSAEKHDSFLELDDDHPMVEFSGKTLRKGESDASSFPSGGLRQTFEARGYTAWDTTSPAFVKDSTLYIPTVFCSYNGEALDKKTPLLKSCEVLSKAVVKLMPYVGLNDVTSAKSCVGAEQEYFLVPDEYYQKRIDLKLTGRTLFGTMAPKGQELEDHYYGSFKRKVAAFMKELDEECWKFAIPAKTKHNEVAPAQHELACIYRDVNITTDNNQLVMQLMQDIAKKHGLRCLLHEKPFKGVNGSGKHNNWSVVTDTGINLFNPGKEPAKNLPFLAILACIIKGVDEFSDLLRVTTAIAGNDFRLGANEAPPAIISMFLGDELNGVIDSYIEGKDEFKIDKTRFNSGVANVADFSKDTTDRNRTSPFAFTGNKFEFRAVGSSQSIAGPNMMLNSILAYEILEMIDLIESGQDIHDVISSFFKEHKRIIFEGDGYSEKWEEEAKRRGLPNRKTTTEALEHFTDEINIKMLTKLGIFTKPELESRRDILFENYSNTIHVEGSTSLAIARKQIYPVAIKYLNNLAKTYNELKDTGIDVEYLKEDINELNSLTNNLKLSLNELEEAIKYYDSINDTALVKANIAKDRIFKSMEKVRDYADKIEDKVDHDVWPMPTYVDLMFGL